jgi:hypothetical protein
MRAGWCWAQATSVLPTADDGSGYLLTPTKADATLCRSLPDGYDRNGKLGSLSEQLLTQAGLHPSALFVERLMDFPETWTALGSSAKPGFLAWQQKHGVSCLSELVVLSTAAEGVTDGVRCRRCGDRMEKNIRSDRCEGCLAATTGNTRRWIRRMKEAGLCLLCGKNPSHGRQYCEGCRVKSNAAKRRRDKTE